MRLWLLALAAPMYLRDAAAKTTTNAPTATGARKPWTTHAYLWNSALTGSAHRIRYATAGCGEPVLLVHGFGGCVDYWRAVIPAVASRGFKVYAIDLLGFGASDKPVDVDYSPELWRDLVRDFAAEHVQRPVVVVGNSIGSLVALNAAALDVALPEEGCVVKAVALLNCAGGMNSKCLFTGEGVYAPRLWEVAILRPVFAALDAVLSTPALRDWAFTAFSSEDTVRSVLEGLYVDKTRVDEDLVRCICSPAADPAAPQVFAKVLTGDPGRRPEEVMKEVLAPILAIWGDEDNFTPVDGPIGRYFRSLADRSGAGDGRQMECAEGRGFGAGVGMGKGARDATAVAPGAGQVRFSVVSAGHVPHDDNPVEVLELLLPFLEEHLRVRNSV